MIIASKVSAVRGAAAFLSRRDIPTYVATTMNDALTFLSDKKPELVLISVNYPHGKMESFPMLLEQSFGVETIIFAEAHDRKSAARLQNIKASHAIHGIISGPSVLMKVRQIEQARQAAIDDSQRSVDPSQPANSGNGANKSADAMVFRGERTKMNEAAMGDLLKVLSQDGSGETLDPSKLRSPEKKAAAANETSETNDISGAKKATPQAPKFEQAEERARQLAAEAAANLEKSKTKPAPVVAKPAASGGPSVAYDPQRASAETKKQTPPPNYGKVSNRVNPLPPRDAGETKAPQQAEEAQTKSASEKPAIAQTAPQPAPRDPAAEAASIAERSAKLHAQVPNPDSVKLGPGEAKSFWSYVTMALATVCQDIPDAIAMPKVTAADLLLVQAKTIRGACVVLSCEGQNRREMIDRFQVAFFSHLRASGIEISAAEQIIITLDDTELAGNSFATADVRAGAAFHQATVGAAMVEVTSVQPEVESAGDQMVKIKLVDLPIELPVSYEVFLHFPKNKKFLRYLKSGAKLSESQMERLQKRKVQHVFLNEAEEEAYRRHYAQRAIRTG